MRMSEVYLPKRGTASAYHKSNQLRTRQTESYILWLGACSPGGATENGFASASAAEYWQQCAINGLRANGKRIICLSREIFSRWPKGPLIVSHNATDISTLPNNAHHVVPHLNLPLSALKNYSLTINYLHYFKKIVEKYGPPEFIISYNIFQYSSAVSTYAKKNFGVATKFLIADQPAPGVFLSYKAFERHILQADQCAFFSWAMYQKYEDRVPAIHFEGGVNVCPHEQILKKREYALGTKVIMYCGSSGKNAGLDQLLEAVAHIRSEKCELWITGHHEKQMNGREQSFYNAPNCKVRMLGFLHADELKIRMQSADLFVNPYDPNYLPNQFNFPSKILLYLQYLKPIVSTWTPGLSPKYREVLCVVDNNSPSCLAKKIDEVISWNEAQCSRNRQHLREFSNSLRWEDQVKRLL